MSTLPGRELLRVDEVAEYFDVHPETVRRWIEHGHLIAERLGGALRVTKESVLAFRLKGRTSIARGENN